MVFQRPVFGTKVERLEVAEKSPRHTRPFALFAVSSVIGQARPAPTNRPRMVSTSLRSRPTMLTCRTARPSLRAASTCVQIRSMAGCPTDRERELWLSSAGFWCPRLDEDSKTRACSPVGMPRVGDGRRQARDQSDALPVPTCRQAGRRYDVKILARTIQGATTPKNSGVPRSATQPAGSFAGSSEKRAFTSESIVPRTRQFSLSGSSGH